MGFLRGFLAPFRGGAYVARHRLWHYLLVPVLLDMALGAATMFASARYWREELSNTLASAPVVGWIFLAVMTVLGGVVLFLVAQPLLLGVFADRLSERVEREVRGAAPSAPFFASTGRALVHGLLKLVLYGLALVIGLALTAVSGVGSLIGVFLGAIFLAYDGFDYPLSRRGASFARKWGYLLRHPAQTLGFGLGATVLYLIPLAVFVAPPFAAAGATLAFLEAESRGQSQRSERSSRNPADGNPARAP